MRQHRARLLGVLGADPRDHCGLPHLRQGGARRVVVHVEGRHVEAALRFCDADDAQCGAVGGVQDDGDLVDGCAAQLIPQDLGDDDGGQALVRVAVDHPASGEHAGPENQLKGGVDGLNRDVVEHVLCLHHRVAAE